MVPKHTVGSNVNTESGWKALKEGCTQVNRISRGASGAYRGKPPSKGLPSKDRGVDLPAEGPHGRGCIPLHSAREINCQIWSERQVSQPRAVAGVAPNKQGGQRKSTEGALTGH